MKHILINTCTILCLLAAGTVMAGDKAAMIASALSAGPGFRYRRCNRERP